MVLEILGQEVKELGEQDAVSLEIRLRADRQALAREVVDPALMLGFQVDSQQFGTAQSVKWT